LSDDGVSKLSTTVTVTTVAEKKYLKERWLQTYGGLRL